MDNFNKHTEFDYIWNNLTDLRPKHQVIEDIIRDPTMLIKSRRVQLRCFNCSKVSRSVYTGKKCACGHYLIHTGSVMRRAAKSLHNAGFKLRAAYDAIVTDGSDTDSSDTALCFVCIDFADIYDERCFFDMGINLPDGWFCMRPETTENCVFTRLYNIKEAPVAAGKAEAEAELKCMAAELEYWGREIEDASAAAIMTLAGYGIFWKIPGYC